MEGWVDLGTAVEMHSPCPRLYYIAAALAVNTTLVVSHCSQMCWPLVRVHFDVVPYFQVPAYDGPTLSPVAPTCYVASITFISPPYKWRITTRRGWRRVCDVSYREACSERGLLSSRVHSVLEKSLQNAWIWNKNFKAIECAWKQIRCLKVLENPRKVLEFKSCEFWNFALLDNF